MSRLFPSRVFIEASDIAAKLSELTFVDVRYDLANPNTYNIQEHTKSRPKGAIFAHVDADLSGTITATSGRHPLPDTKKFIDWCMKRNIGSKPTICFDDKGGAMAASRLWWMLDILGAEAYVLNGGVQAYKAAGFPLQSGDKDPLPSQGMSSWPHKESWAHAVTDTLPDTGSVVDARFTERFHSTVRGNGMDKLPGHHCCAKNLPWPSNLENFRLRDPELVKKSLREAIGGDSAENSIFMCASGVTTCFNIALSRHFGFGQPKLHSVGWSKIEAVERDRVRKEAMATYGLVCDIVTKNQLAPKATMSSVTVTPPSAATECAHELKVVVEQLHQGEELEVETIHGKKFNVKASPPSKI